MPSCSLRGFSHQSSVSPPEVSCSGLSVLSPVLFNPVISLEYPFELMRTVDDREEPDCRSTRLLG